MADPHAFILHLERAVDRRANAEALAACCGMVSEIWPAVDGGAMNEAECAGWLAEALFRPRYPHALKPGELGCFLSHRAMWTEIVARDLPWALIIEDDAELDAGRFAEARSLAADHVGTYGYIQLQDRPPKQTAPTIDQRGDCVLTHPKVTPLRTTAQMVSRAAATHLLARSETIDRPVDTFVQSHWHTGLRAAVIHPSGVGTIAAETTIQSGRKSLAEKARRELARARYLAATRRLSARSTAAFHKGAGI